MIGLFTMLIVITPTFFLLEGIALLMGIFDGCFISLLGPIAFDLTGHSGAGQAIGFLLGFCSIPLTVGPPIAGNFVIFFNMGVSRGEHSMAAVPFHHAKKKHKLQISVKLINNYIFIVNI